MVIFEMWKRNYNIKSMDNYDKYLKQVKTQHIMYEFKEHDDEYLTICYYNLKEKYLRGQNDFTDDVWNKLDDFYKRRMSNEKFN